jgi:hypothetical protein
LKKFTVLLIVFALVFAFGNSFAQDKLIIHLTGGYNVPMGELGKGADIPVWGTTTTLPDPVPYYMKAGFNFGGDVKYAFLAKKDFMLKGALSFSYNMFSTKLDASGTITGGGAFSYTQDLKMNIFTIGIGPEFSFMPKGKVSPFIGVDFTINMITGDNKYTAVTGLPTGTLTDATYKSSTRMGIGGNFGLDFKFSKQVGAVLGGRLNMINLIGKKSIVDEPMTTGSTEMPLWDKGDASSTTFKSDRSMMSFDIYAGVSFFLMQPKTVKK